MLLKLFLAFTLIPVIEIYFIIKIGSFLGAGTTIVVMLLTGFIGAWLARTQGISVLGRLQRNMEQGISPGGEMLEAVLILVAGVVLLTPGFLTDIMGILLLIPAVRSMLKEILRRKIETMIQKGSVTIIKP